MFIRNLLFYIRWIFYLGAFYSVQGMEKERQLLDIFPQDIWNLIFEHLEGNEPFLRYFARFHQLENRGYSKIADKFLRTLKDYPSSEQVSKLISRHFYTTHKALAPKVLRSKMKDELLAHINCEFYPYGTQLKFLCPEEWNSLERVNELQTFYQRCYDHVKKVCFAVRSVSTSMRKDCISYLVNRIYARHSTDIPSFKEVIDELLFALKRARAFVKNIRKDTIDQQINKYNHSLAKDLGYTVVGGTLLYAVILRRMYCSSFYSFIAALSMVQFPFLAYRVYALSCKRHQELNTLRKLASMPEECKRRDAIDNAYRFLEEQIAKLEQFKHELIIEEN